MRQFLEKYAKETKKMDPLLPQTWYNISARELNRMKGGRTILMKFKGYFSALSHLFPDVPFDRECMSSYLFFYLSPLFTCYSLCINSFPIQWGKFGSSWNIEEGFLRDLQKATILIPSIPKVGTQQR